MCVTAVHCLFSAADIDKKLNLQYLLLCDDKISILSQSSSHQGPSSRSSSTPKDG